MLHDARCNMEICCPEVKISQDGETLHFRRQTNSWIMIEVKATVLFWRYLQDSNVLDIVCFRLTYHHGQNIMHNYTHNNTTREWTDICYETLNILLKYSAQRSLLIVRHSSAACFRIQMLHDARCNMEICCPLYIIRFYFVVSPPTWSIGARRHGQEGALAPPPPLEML